MTGSTLFDPPTTHSISTSTDRTTDYLLRWFPTPQTQPVMLNRRDKEEGREVEEGERTGQARLEVRKGRTAARSWMH